MTARSALVAELRGAVQWSRVIDDPDVLLGFQRDQAAFAEAGAPAAAVLAGSATDVQAVVRCAAEHRVAVVTRGAGSGLSGGANAIDGCIVLVTTPMNRIVEIDPLNQLAVVQPGVLNTAVAAAAAAEGLWYPPDPASREFCTIGGNVATNAGGLCCVRYGVTGDYVLGLEVVLADGSLVRVGRRTIKGVAGYDLTALFVGSEGTLGVITEVTLRLRPPPPPQATVVATFADLAAAGAAVVSMTRFTTPSLLELMDSTTVAAVESWKRMELDTTAAALLMMQIDRGGDGAAEVTRICARAGAVDVIRSDDPDEAEMLLAARRFALPALERRGAVLLDDVAVPRAALPALVEGVSRLGATYGVEVAVFGHAGDGNMHPTFVYDASDPGAATQVWKAFGAVVELALDLGGTSTGEHGIGHLKRVFLATELGPESAALHERIRATLDPNGLLNPGKVFRAVDVGPTESSRSATGCR